MNETPCHNCNFGLVYGMSANGYRAYAKASYGVELTKEEAEDSRAKFFETYSGLIPWHKDAIARTRRDKGIVSPLGRTRHLPLVDSRQSGIKAQAERNALNAPVQSTLSDMSLWASVLYDRMYDFETAPIVLMVHDNLVSYVPEDDAGVWAKRLQVVMETLPLKEVFGWDHQVPFTTDIHVGPNLADLEEI